MSLVVQSLMIAFAVVMLDELVHRCPEMPFPQRNHPIQTLFFNRSYEPLRVCVTVRRLERRLHHAYGGFLQQVADSGAPLPIPVADQDTAVGQRSVVERRHRAGGLDHERVVRVRRTPAWEERWHWMKGWQ